MNRMITGAFALALATAVAAPAPAAGSNPENDEIEVYVVNSHTVPVRVFAEDAEGRIHSLGLVQRGAVTSVEVPAKLASTEYRLKFVPTPVDAFSSVSAEDALKTALLSSDRVRQVTVWIEPTLDLSDIEINEVVQN